MAPGPSARFAQMVFRSHVKSGLFQRLASITTNIAHLTLDESLEASENLPAPEIIARDIVEDIRAALEQFESVALDLGDNSP